MDGCKLAHHRREGDTRRDFGFDLTMRWIALECRMRSFFKRLMQAQEGQGTTEYAILVGVLVVIAIIAIAAFKDKLQSLWDDISSGINGL